MAIKKKDLVMDRTVIPYNGINYVYQGIDCNGNFLLLDTSRGKQIRLPKIKFEKIWNTIKQKTT
jgi:hypothetical protein